MEEGENNVTMYILVMYEDCVLSKVPTNTTPFIHIYVPLQVNHLTIKIEFC